MKDRTWQLLEKHLDSGSFYLVAAHESAPDRSSLVSIASELNCTFPEEYLVHASSEFGGVYVEVIEDLWPRPKELDVGPFWTFLYGLFVYNATSDIPEWMNIQLNGRSFQQSTGHEVVPFLKVIGDADVYCFTNLGSIVRWEHETNELRPASETFFEVLDFELGELRSRKDKMVAGKD